jgi:hypothetical protein
LTTPTTTGTTLYSSTSHTNDMTTTPSSKSATPQSGSSSITGSSSATNLGTLAMMTGSPEKMSYSMHQPTKLQTGNSTTSTTQQQHNHQVQQQNGGQTEIFSRLVMTNVSNLTKITKELTVRMPRSSFRDYVLSQQTFGSSSSASAVAVASTGPGGAGGATGGHFGMITSAGGGGIPNGGATAHGGAGGYGYGFGYGPAAASILAMRKGSLI